MGVFENIFKKIIYQVFFQKTLLSDFYLFFKYFIKFVKQPISFQKHFLFYKCFLKLLSNGLLNSFNKMGKKIIIIKAHEDVKFK